MNLLKRINDWRRNPKQKAVSLIPQLLQLRDQLVTNDARPLYGIVQFFNEVSVWHDRSDEISEIIIALQEVNYGQHSELIQKLETLRKHFQNAGRDCYGLNRTEKGEIVTADKVFLGDIYGLFTHPVSYWMGTKDEPKNLWAGGMWGDTLKGKNSYDVTSEQARGFISSHIKPMCETIDWLSQNAKVAKVA